MEVWINDKKAKIGLQYQRSHNCKYDYTFMLNEKEEGQADVKEELSQSSIKPIWRIPLSRSMKLIKKMNTESVKDPTAPISKKQKKLLHQISKLKWLIDDTVHALVEEVNSRGTPMYQKETKGESNTLHTEKETETIHNLITNPISEEKLPTILKEIQEVID